MTEIEQRFDSDFNTGIIDNKMIYYDIDGIIQKLNFYIKVYEVRSEILLGENSPKSIQSSFLMK